MVKPRKPLRPRSPNQLEERFLEHLAFLDKSARDYDAGDKSEFMRIAHSLRVLLHKTKVSTPLIEHIGLSDDCYVTYAYPLDERNLVGDCAITMMCLTNEGVTYQPTFDCGPTIPRYIVSVASDPLTAHCHVTFFHAKMPESKGPYPWVNIHTLSKPSALPSKSIPAVAGSGRPASSATSPARWTAAS